MGATSSARQQHRRNGLATYRFIRYADDFVALVAGTRAQAEALREELAAVLRPMGLRLSETKTKIVHIDEGFIQRHRKRGTRKRFVHTYAETEEVVPCWCLNRAHAAFTPDPAWAAKQAPPKLVPRPKAFSVSTSVRAFDASSTVHFRSSSPVLTGVLSRSPFSATLTTPAVVPAQLAVVWSLPLRGRLRGLAHRQHGITSGRPIYIGSTLDVRGATLAALHPRGPSRST